MFRSRSGLAWDNCSAIQPGRSILGVAVIASNLIESLRLLSAVAEVFALRCVAGLTAEIEVARAYADSSPAMVTALNKIIGYDEAAAIAKQALAENRTIREVVLARGHDIPDLDTLLDPRRFL